jgi:hypothetical protein
MNRESATFSEISAIVAASMFGSYSQSAYLTSLPNDAKRANSAVQFDTLMLPLTADLLIAAPKHGF